LILTLSLIALSVILVAYINNKSSGYIPFARLAVDRQKAHALAYGGVQLALSQLATAAPGTQKAKPTALDHTKALLTTLLPVHNQWQSFTLKNKEDGFDGELKICITCESGKIDINKIYDYKTKKFVGEGQKTGDYKKIMEALFERITPLVHGTDLFKGFEKFLKERHYNIQDVTELLLIKEFAAFKNNVFYEPLAQKPSEKEMAPQQGIFLTDIFTVWSGKATITPWLISSSLGKLLKFQPIRSEVTKEQKMIQEQLKNFAIKTEWSSQTWDKQITPFYGITFKEVPEFAASLFNNTFEPTTFSVLSQAKVGTITQRLLAIVQRDESLQPDSAAFGVTIKKLYWL
jgi:hypothetical protein